MHKWIFIIMAAALAQCACAKKQLVELAYTPQEVRGFYLPQPPDFRRVLEITPTGQEDSGTVRVRVQSNDKVMEQVLPLQYRQVYFKDGMCRFAVRFKDTQTAEISGAGDNCRSSGQLSWTAIIDGEYKKIPEIAAREAAGIYKTSSSNFTADVKITALNDKEIGFYARHVSKADPDTISVVVGKGLMRDKSNYAIINNVDCTVIASFEKGKTGEVETLYLDFGDKYCSSYMGMGKKLSLGKPVVYDKWVDKKAIKAEKERLEKIKEEELRKKEQEAAARNALLYGQ